MKKILLSLVFVFLVFALSQKTFGQEKLKEKTKKVQSKKASETATNTLKVNEDRTDKNLNSLMFLNAGTFDFANSKLSEYVFHFNVFAPEIIGKVGVNTGMMKINYSINKDSLDGNVYTGKENILLHPLDEIKVGNKYLKQYNSARQTINNSAWSYYVQPTYRFINEDKFTLLAHLHFELLVNKYQITSDYKNIQQDTAIMDNSPIVYQANNKFSKSITDAVTTITNLSNLSFCGGLGVTFYAKPWSGGCLFIQPTLGFTFDYKQPVGSNALSVAVSGGSLFYLTRAYIQQDITDNMKGIIGFDSRGNFAKGNITNVYAAYIGVNLSLDGLKKLFGNSGTDTPKKGSKENTIVPEATE